jgi:hypothetical protein
VARALCDQPRARQHLRKAGAVSIERTKYDTWQVRWRDPNGRQCAKNFRKRSLAEKFERQVRAKEEAPSTPEIYEPLWRRALRSQLEDWAAIEVDGFNPNGFFVYMLWDRSETHPVYVGATQNVMSRVGVHLRNPDRRHRIGRVTLIRCSSVEAMENTEADLIDHYRPEFNGRPGIRRKIGRGVAE